MIPDVNIIAVDWGKDVDKRSAYVSLPSRRRIEHLPFGGRVVDLLEHAASLTGPVLIGIDAAIGLPAGLWSRLYAAAPRPGTNFADFLFDAALNAEFFEPVQVPVDWRPDRPFIRPPRGRWSLKAFDVASHQCLRRQIDRQLNANSLFVTCGIPGSVGSGTRALWQELIAARASRDFRIWPFHGTLAASLDDRIPVIAEIYPKACYGIALAESLPAELEGVAKTKAAARERCLSRLGRSGWLRRFGIGLSDLDRALSNEDDFDALLSAAALTRLVLEAAPLEAAETVDAEAEGGILGAASLKPR